MKERLRDIEEPVKRVLIFLLFRLEVLKLHYVSEPCGRLIKILIAGSHSEVLIQLIRFGGI